VEMDGTAGQLLNLKVRAHAADLTELNSLIAPLQQAAAEPSATAPSLRSTNLAGAADLQVLVEGTMSDPRIRGQLAGRSLQVENTQWRSLELRLQASKSGVSI
jgi:autotransporter translocation and assembly factor TamB